MGSLGYIELLAALKEGWRPRDEGHFNTVGALIIRIGFWTPL